MNISTSPIVREGAGRTATAHDHLSRQISREQNENAGAAAGYIQRVDMLNFPTPGSPTKTILLSPERQKVAVVNGRHDEARIILLAIRAAFGVPIWKLSHQGRNLVECLQSPYKAVIRITIWNEGPKAFEPQLYGSQIVVERQVSCIGTAISCNDLRIAKKADNVYTVVAKDAESLDRMLRHFKIHLQHPLFRIDQNSWNYISQASSSSRQLYKIFLRCTCVSEGTGEEEDEGRRIPRTLKSLLNARAAKEAELKKLQAIVQQQDRQRFEHKMCYHLATYREQTEEAKSKRKVSP